VIQNIGEQSMKKLLIIIILFVAVTNIYKVINRHFELKELERVNHDMVEYCTQYMQNNPDAICD